MYENHPLVVLRHKYTKQAKILNNLWTRKVLGGNYYRFKMLPYALNLISRKNLHLELHYFNFNAFDKLYVWITLEAFLNESKEVWVTLNYSWWTLGKGCLLYLWSWCRNIFLWMDGAALLGISVAIRNSSLQSWKYCQILTKNRLIFKDLKRSLISNWFLSWILIESAQLLSRLL